MNWPRTIAATPFEKAWLKALNVLAHARQPTYTKYNIHCVTIIIHAQSFLYSMNCGTQIVLMRELVLRIVGLLFAIWVGLIVMHLLTSAAHH